MPFDVQKIQQRMTGLALVHSAERLEVAIQVIYKVEADTIIKTAKRGPDQDLTGWEKVFGGAKPPPKRRL